MRATSLENAHSRLFFISFYRLIRFPLHRLSQRQVQVHLIAPAWRPGALLPPPERAKGHLEQGRCFGLAEAVGRPPATQAGGQIGRCV
jgi:hypothetical protein